jgi:hypothetical protein
MTSLKLAYIISRYNSSIFMEVCGKSQAVVEPDGACVGSRSVSHATAEYGIFRITKRHCYLYKRLVM